jgi:hypothetical protein
MVYAYDLAQHLATPLCVPARMFSHASSFGRCAENRQVVSCSIERKAQIGAVLLLAKRDKEGVRALDDLAMGLNTGAISRGRAIKLGGAALVASALGLFASRGADAQEETVVIAVRRRRCVRRGGNWCKVIGGCSECCNSTGRRPKACCGRYGCRCCRRNQRCRSGRCR